MITAEVVEVGGVVGPISVGVDGPVIDLRVTPSPAVVVDVSSVGAAGSSGPPGPAAGAVEVSRPAGVVMSAGTVVSVDESGQAVPFVQGVWTRAAVGVTRTAAGAAGVSVVVVEHGLIPDLSIPPGRYYAATGGLLSLSAPGTGVLQSVGWSSGASLFVDLGDPIIRS